MVCRFMEDRTLQGIARILVHVTGPLEAEYYRVIDLVSGGWNNQARFAAERGNRSVVQNMRGDLEGSHSAEIP